MIGVHRYTGVRISNVAEYSPAAGAEIEDDDVIIAVNGKLVLGSSFDDAIGAIEEAGAVIVMSLARAIDVDAPESPFWDVFINEPGCS